MSKIISYKCDNCGDILPDEEISGIHGTQDLFNRLASYPFEHKDNSLCNVHCCTDCYKINVLNFADCEVNPRKFPEENQAKRRELSFILREKLVRKSYLASKTQKVGKTATQAKIFV